MNLKCKKIMSYMMIIILCGSVYGCGTKEDSQKQPDGQKGNVIEEKEENPGQNVDKEETKSFPDEYVKQIRLIAESKDIWYLPAEYENENYEYAITDLDENGRLEIIISDMGGNGSYSHNNFFEINEAQDGIVRMQNLTEDEKVQPDILIDLEKVYIDSDGIHHYIVTDYLKKDEKTYYITTGVMSVLENQISLEYLASRTEVETDKGVRASHKDYAGNDISEDEYYRIVEEYFDGYPEWRVNIEWNNAREIKNMDTEELMKQLMASAQGFVFEKHSN